MIHYEKPKTWYVGYCGYQPINCDGEPDDFTTDAPKVTCPSCKNIMGAIENVTTVVQASLKKSISDMSDLEYLEHKLFSALKVPKEYLGL